jgi:hypothetical protein
VTLRRKSDGYIEARSFCEVIWGNWRNDADNTTKLKKLLPELAPKPVRTSIRWCALRTVPHTTRMGGCQHRALDAGEVRPRRCGGHGGSDM